METNKGTLCLKGFYKNKQPVANSAVLLKNVAVDFRIRSLSANWLAEPHQKADAVARLASNSAGVPHISSIQ
jgi:hypothetical protein